MTEGSGTEEILKRIKGLSLIDASVVEVISLLDDKESNFDQIVGKLTPTITARFLQMANSAYYGVSVRTIDHAVRMLGFSGMKQILVTSLLIDHFSSSDKASHFDFQKFQSQARFCSVVSRVLGDIVGYKKLEDLFTVSMLHNIGKVIIAIYLRDEYEEIQALMQSEKMQESEAEEKVLGLNHAEIGALVLERFHIPDDICNAVKFHNLKNYEVRDGDNYELDLILRASTPFMNEFDVSYVDDSMELNDVLREAVIQGRQLYAIALKNEIMTQGHRAVFPQLLKEASSLINESLRKTLTP